MRSSCPTNSQEEGNNDDGKRTLNGIQVPQSGSMTTKDILCGQNGSVGVNLGHRSLNHKTSSNNRHPIQTLLEKSRDWLCEVTDLSFAKRLDSEDPLHHLRNLFHYPKKCDLPDIDRSLLSDDDEESVYLCGNSLGLMPKATADWVNGELVKWAKMGVHGHKNGQLPWQESDEFLIDQMAPLVGAQTNEVALMNGLTVNEHLLLISFYQPTKERHKILIEDHAFPSDHYCVESQIRQRGFDPATSMLLIKPRQGEETIRTEDILQMIEEEGHSIAIVLLPGVQYFTGQIFDIAAITKAGQAKGCFVGFDLAHAVGNIELFMHDWNVDFACWCTYKYLSSSAGGMAGIFIHERYIDADLPKLTGWWGHRLDTRFNMDNKLDRIPGPLGYRLSNPPCLLSAALKGSLEVFDKTSIAELRQKSKLLTAYLEYLLLRYYAEPKAGSSSYEGSRTKPTVTIITPTDPDERGCQLSVRFSLPIAQVFKELMKSGVVLDRREPNVLRVAPLPMYNSFEDVHRFISHLNNAFKRLENNTN